MILVVSLVFVSITAKTSSIFEVHDSFLIAIL